MPDAMRNNSVDVDLKLQGDKIKLETRPISRESTASSRSAYLLQGPSRPVSAVPMLSLYKHKDDYDLSTRSRRPYSADNFVGETTKSNTFIDETQSEDISSLNSAEELESDSLPSSELLKALISEPIISWREGNVYEPAEMTSDRKSMEQVQLTPGLTTKPPIPKKLNPDTTRSAKDVRFSEIDVFSEHKQSKVRRCASEGEVQFQNWMSVEEKQTDSILEKVKQQQKQLAITYEPHQKPQIQNVTFERFFADPPPLKILSSPAQKTTIIEKPAPKKPEIKPALKAKPIIKTTKKSKFTPKPIKTCKDIQATKIDDVDSWMAKPTYNKDVANWVYKADDTDFEKIASNYKENKEPHTKGDILIPEKEQPDEFDDIASILEVLEAESAKSKSQIKSIKKIVNTELNSARNVEVVLNGKNSPVSKCSSTSSSSAKEDIICQKSNNFIDILKFLDEVDKNSAVTLNNATERLLLSNQMIENVMQLDTIPKLDDLLKHSQVELSKQVIDLNLRLKEKSSSIKLLQDEISSLREHVMTTKRETDKIVKAKMKSLKEETAEVVKRHQHFIDQLIDEKQALHQQCQTLIHETKVIEDRYGANLKAAEHRHQVELHKAKEMHIAGEKIRRERWLDNKTQKIKQMTVKSIEPEIQSMTMRHEQELADLRSLHKREIEDIELKNARKMQQQCEALRVQLTEEREKALAHEREVIRIRYESIVETEEKSYIEQRKRLLQEHANRMAECDAKEAALATEKERAYHQVQEEYDDKLQVIVRRHANEISMLKETTQNELETFKSNFKKQMDLELAAREQTIREVCKKERDREIDAVIDRLEKEAMETKMQVEALNENRIRRIKDKFEKEMKDLEYSEAEAKNKYVENKGKLLEAEDQVVSLKQAIKNLEFRLKDTAQAHEKLLNEKNTIRESIREEVKQEISDLEKEILKVRNDKDTELQQVYARVKVAVSRKDEMLGELSRDHLALKEKCKYLESMLEQQRKEYLIK